MALHVPVCIVYCLFRGAAVVCGEGSDQVAAAVFTTAPHALLLSPSSTVVTSRTAGAIVIKLNMFDIASTRYFTVR